MRKIRNFVQLIAVIVASLALAQEVNLPDLRDPNLAETPEIRKARAASGIKPENLPKVEASSFGHWKTAGELQELQDAIKSACRDEREVSKECSRLREIETNQASEKLNLPFNLGRDYTLYESYKESQRKNQNKAPAQKTTK